MTTALAHDIADEASIALLDCHSVECGGWRDLGQIDSFSVGAINQAMNYLFMRDLLERHPTEAGKFRFVG